MRSDLFNRLYRDFIKRTYRYCSVYEGQMNQISQWISVVFNRGTAKVDFGNAPFDFTAVYYGTWDGIDIQTLSFERLIMPTVVKEGDSILVTLNPSLNGKRVFGNDNEEEEWRAY